MVPTVYSLSKNNLYSLIHRRFGHVLIYRLRQMARKGIMKGIGTHIYDLEEPLLVCLMDKANKLPEYQPLMSQNFPLVPCFK